jgi:Co/Zn/Cd efflux system component
MANSMPIPEPPRTPTPPLYEPAGLGEAPYGQADVVYDPQSLSPNKPFGKMSTPSTPYYIPERRNSARSEDGSGPFNFQTSTMAKSPVGKFVRYKTRSRLSPIHYGITDLAQNIGQRRGHKYKHSSVSHQIFLEPPSRAPLALPNSLPQPTLKECIASMSKDQKFRFWWSICHMLVAGYTAWNAHSSAAVEALSHLIFFDSLGALLCVAVEVLGNFEVWGRSSIRHPFGLQRMEVVAGFALSVLLIFMGFDLLSHNAKHALEGVGHEAHRPHSHQRVAAGTLDMTAILAIVSTLISAVGLKNHARIGKAMRFAAMENLPSILSNPSHLLTLSCSFTLLILPLLSLHAYEWIDKSLSLSIAVAMCFLGVHLGKNVGSMLLMSYSGKGVPEVIREIEADALVKNVEQAKFWQAHYGVGMANLRLRVRGSEANLLKLRERITSLIRNRLSGGYGAGGQRWEVSIQFKIDQDHGHIHDRAHEFASAYGGVNI